MWHRPIIFLLINFLGLGIGSYFTGPGVSSDWYNSLNQAPWTPPGWVFGFVWTTIMICFAIYMTFLYELAENKSKLIALFVLQWILNAGWNPIFFKFQLIGWGLIVISSLIILVAFFLYNYWNKLENKSYLILPYLVWLVIATSLNAYILVNN